MTPTVTIERLNAGHDRSRFNCGQPVLDRYLKEYSTQDVKRRVSNCFVAVASNGELAGFYTLAASSAACDELPEQTIRKLPRYPSVPANLIGRLAVDIQYHGQRIGALMVADVVKRSIDADAAVYAILVDAKDDNARSFYERLGFVSFKTRPNSLILPIATALAARGAGGSRS